jgi:transposase-like protein
VPAEFAVPKKYPVELQERALALLVANDGNLSKTARELGIGRRVVERWRNKAQTDGEWDQQRAEIRTKIIRDAHATVAAGIAELRLRFCGDLSGERLKDLAYSFAILVDKMIILEGSTLRDEEIAGGVRDFVTLVRSKRGAIARKEASSCGTA